MEFHIILKHTNELLYIIKPSFHTCCFCEEKSQRQLTCKEKKNNETYVTQNLFNLALARGSIHFNVQCSATAYYYTTTERSQI